MNSTLTAITRWLKAMFADSDTDAAAVEVRLRAGPVKTQNAAEPRTDGQPEDKVRNPRVELAEECDEVGFKTARSVGEVEPRDIDLKALEARADAEAQAHHRPPSEEKDERHRQKLSKAEALIKRAHAAWEAAWAKLRKLRQERAELGELGPYPKINPIFRQAAAVGLMIAFAPNFHDLAADLPGILPWVFGIGCALGVSLMIIHGILPPGAPGEE
jgi:hypothetical protein